MLDTFLEKLFVFFDRRFILPYWVPVFLASAAALGGVMAALGLSSVLGWWAGLDGTEKPLLGIAVLLIVTALAYLLQALTVPIVQWYEGYWPWRWLADWSRAHHKQVMQALDKEIAGHSSAPDDPGDQPDQLAGNSSRAEQRDEPGSDSESETPTPLGNWALHRLVRDYPHEHPDEPLESSKVRPTLLGNILTTAEEYPYNVYGLDTVAWWPRLMPLLPESFRRQLEEAVSPLILLINLSGLLALLTLAFGVAFAFAEDHWVLMFVAMAIGAGLSWLSYEAAVNQARVYGDLIRVAFDLHRHEMLRQMGLPVPKTLEEEKERWSVLNRLVLYDEPLPRELSYETPSRPLELKVTLENRSQ